MFLSSLVEAIQTMGSGFLVIITVMIVGIFLTASGSEK